MRRASFFYSLQTCRNDSSASVSYSHCKYLAHQIGCNFLFRFRSCDFHRRKSFHDHNPGTSFFHRCGCISPCRHVFFRARCNRHCIRYAFHQGRRCNTPLSYPSTACSLYLCTYQSACMSFPDFQWSVHCQQFWTVRLQFLRINL